MMRLILALVVMAALATSAFGAAAALPVNGGVIQAGSDNTLSCDPDGIYVDGYGFELDNLKVSYVRFGGIHDDCLSARVFAAVYDSGGTQLDGNLQGTLTAPLSGPANDNKLKLSFASAVPAASIHEIHVGIQKP